MKEIRMRSCLFLSLVAAALFPSTEASAQTVLKSGKIVRVSVFDAGNYAFRILLNTPVPECGDGFFYVAATDPNYQVYTAGLLAAASTNRPIQVQAVLQNGFCRIVNYNIEF